VTAKRSKQANAILSSLCSLLQDQHHLHRWFRIVFGSILNTLAYRTQIAEPTQVPPMAKKESGLCKRLKQLGFRQESQMRLYGEVFELLGDPLVMRDDLVFVDAIEKKSGRRRRVRIPLTILNMANGERRAA
jgi:hypothetical protein